MKPGFGVRESRTLCDVGALPLDGRQDVRRLLVAAVLRCADHPLPVRVAVVFRNPDLPWRIEPGDEPHLADSKREEALLAAIVDEQQIGRLLRVADEEGAAARREILLELDVLEPNARSVPHLECQPELLQRATGRGGESQSLFAKHYALLVQRAI